MTMKARRLGQAEIKRSVTKGREFGSRNIGDAWIKLADFAAYVVVAGDARDLCSSLRCRMPAPRFGPAYSEVVRWLILRYNEISQARSPFGGCRSLIGYYSLG